VWPLALSFAVHGIGDRFAGDDSLGRSTVVYSAYERTVITALAGRLPHLAPRLEALLPRLRDLLKVVRDGYYHPQFGGSFSIKSVLPVLSPELSYDDLEIGDGSLAAIRYLQALDTPDATERERIFAALRDYCARDTLALVQVRRALEARAADLNGRRPVPPPPGGRHVILDTHPFASP